MQEELQLVQVLALAVEERLLVPWAARELLPLDPEELLVEPPLRCCSLTHLPRALLQSWEG